MMPIVTQRAQEEVGKARLQHPDLVILIEVPMIQAIGTVNVASMLMTGQLPSAGCVSIGDTILLVKLYHLDG